MKAMIDKLRVDFGRVVAARIQAGLWTEDDEAMAGEAIRKAIERSDKDLVLCWARWLAVLSARDLMETPRPDPVTVATHGCDECQHKTTRFSSSGYCGGRADLAPVYGEGHPLRVLPADGGVSCARFKERR